MQQGLSSRNDSDDRKRGFTMKMKQQTKWYEKLWIASSIYLILSPFNILFAWLGLLCFFIPLLISMFKGSKVYCNRYCGRGQLLTILGDRFKLSRNKATPRWMRSNYFRYGFLIFFLTMFVNMLMNTYYVLRGAKGLKQVITILWTFKLPWNFATYSYASSWIVQFGFGFYSIMLTSTILGLITMLLYKPRSWCVYCPMGTMTRHL